MIRRFTLFNIFNTYENYLCFFMMRVINPNNTHISNLLIEIVFLIVCDMDCHRFTKELIDLFQ